MKDELIELIERMEIQINSRVRVDNETHEAIIALIHAALALIATRLQRLELWSADNDLRAAGIDPKTGHPIAY